MRTLALLLAVVVAGCATEESHGYHEVQVVEVSHASYSALLGRYVDASGHVDYGRWKATPRDVAELDEYLNLVANASPESRPGLFPAARDRLAYWMNAYNALVMRTILDRWPLESVNDVKSGLSLFRGQGFFRNLRFQVGHTWLSLDDIEERVRALDDPRMHFAMNCGSGGCPALDATAFAGEDLDRTLERKAHDFVNDPTHVKVDPVAKKVVLSKIFDWFGDDFVKAKPGAKDVLDYITDYADPGLAKQLSQARAAGYELEFADYDWSINKAR
jgi:hypothetical protein